MRIKGSTSPINGYRTRFIASSYKRILKTSKQPLTLYNIAVQIAAMPTPEFYISEEAAMKFLRGKSNSIQRSSPHRAACFQAFKKIIDNIKVTCPQLTKREAIRKALKHPAPNCGIAPSTIFATLVNLNQKRKTKKKNKTNL